VKILLTGAHFTPAQAVIEGLQALNSQALQDDKIEIVYVGRTTTREGDSTPSVESEVLPKLRVKFVPITAGRIRKVFDILTIISLLKIPIGLNIKSFPNTASSNGYKFYSKLRQNL